MWPIEKSSPHPLFLPLKPKWNASNEVWFMTNVISCNKLCLLLLMRCWNYMNGGGVYTLGVWFGGNKPHEPYFIW
jgi:hypothetical protein